MMDENNLSSENTMPSNTILPIFLTTVCLINSLYLTMRNQNITPKKIILDHILSMTLTLIDIDFGNDKANRNFYRAILTTHFLVMTVARLINYIRTTEDEFIEDETPTKNETLTLQIENLIDDYVFSNNQQACFLNEEEIITLTNIIKNFDPSEQSLELKTFEKYLQDITCPISLMPYTHPITIKAHYPQQQDRKWSITLDSRELLKYIKQRSHEGKPFFAPHLPGDNLADSAHIKFSYGFEEKTKKELTKYVNFARRLIYTEGNNINPKNNFNLNNSPFSLFHNKTQTNHDSSLQHRNSHCQTLS